MTHETVNTVMHISRSQGTPRLALMVLAFSADWKGYVSMNLRTIAALCNVSKTTVVNALEKLTELDELTVVHTGGGRKTPAQYRVTVGLSEEEKRVSGPPRHILKSVREEVMRRDGLVCGYCKATCGPFHLDHIIPVSRGGKSVADNLIVACAPCNLAKSARTPEEMGWKL